MTTASAAEDAGRGRQVEDASAERAAAFDASVVTDLAQLPADYLARVQADVAALVTRRGAAQQEVPRAS